MTILDVDRDELEDSAIEQEPSDNEIQLKSVDQDDNRRIDAFSSQYQSNDEEVKRATNINKSYGI